MEEETEIDLWQKNLAVQMTGSKDEVNVGFRFRQLAQTRIYVVGFGQNLPMPLPSLLKMAGNILLNHCFGCCCWFLLRPLLAGQQQRSRLVEELEVDEVVNDDDLKRIS